MDACEIPTLLTERLRLRSFCKSDVDDYAALYADPEVVRYLSGGTEPWDRGRAWRHLAFLLGHWRLRGCGMWAVEQRATGAFLGVVGFAEPAGWPGCELAWTLARRWWGNGYATEGARAALAYAFAVLDKDRVISLIHPDNRASIRVAERLGERPQGRIQHVSREMLCYGIDRESYASRRLPEALVSRVFGKPRPRALTSLAPLSRWAGAPARPQNETGAPQRPRKNVPPLRPTAG
jgi:RimJ/RimL family protein N-acetyltransferase